MSVIVKGMEMPKYCYDCPLQDGETGICNILGTTVYDIPKECPLVEVVRCKDCDNWTDENGREGLCQVWSDFEDAHYRYTPKDGYCSEGEKREE